MVSTMKYQDYQEIYAEALRLDEDFDIVFLPVELQENEPPEDAFLRFLTEQKLIEMNEDRWRIVDRDRVKAYNPSLLKMLDAITMATKRAELDEMEEKGLLFMTADDEGNIIYKRTEKGLAEAQD